MLEIMNQSFVTISIDDGHPTDLRARDLLEKYGLKATFYVPARNQERAVMSQAELRSLGTRFEIGGHTLNHVPLKMLPKRQAWAEINDGKKWLDTRSFLLLPPREIQRCDGRTRRRSGFSGRSHMPVQPEHFSKEPISMGC